MLVYVGKVRGVASLMQQCLQGSLAAAQLVWCGEAGEVGMGGHPAAISSAPRGLHNRHSRATPTAATQL